MRASLIFVIAACWALQAGAVSIEKPLADTQRETEAQALFRSLKCVVCEGQSLAESDATLAVQMRGHIRSMLAEGASADEVTHFYRERYGDQIVLTPPLAGHTVLLWAAPLMLVLAGGFAIRSHIRRKGRDGHG